MKKRLAEILHRHFHHPNYAIFLVSLISLILLPPFSPDLRGGSIILELTFGFVIFIACIFTSSSYRDLILLSVIGAVDFILFMLYLEADIVLLLNPILTTLFFTLIFVRLVRYVLQPREITLNDIFALASGYLVLGVVATPFFYFLAMQIPNAFSIAVDNQNFYQMMYFSYITLSSVGYGDITPVHPIAQSFTMVLSLIGQLYLTMLAGIIIGKFVSKI